MNAPRTLLTLKRASAPEGPLVEERLHKVLANAGLGSRRLLEERIQAGEVRVNGAVAEIGMSVHAGDRVELDSKLFVAINDSAEHAQVLVFHKPDGVVTTREDPEGRPTVFEQLPRLKGARWIAVGRLDINTTGLLLLTTDGALAHKLMHPSAEVEREYICRVHGEVPDEALEKLQAGVELDDGPARFEELAVISRGDSHSWFRVVIREGRNREVRRMWESQGLMVSRLKRIRYGNIELPRGLLKGNSQELEADQVKALRDLVGASDPEPTLTLQAVIGQRRANKSAANEFRPAPRTQQAWTGAGDEGRELRAYDRIREDKPFARPGGKRKPGGTKPRRTGPGGAPGQDRGPRPPRRGGPGQQQQVGVYQPQPRWMEERSGGAARPQQRRGKPGARNENTGWRPPVTGAPGERDQQRRGRPGGSRPGGRNENSGWRPPVTGAPGERDQQQRRGPGARPGGRPGGRNENSGWRPPVTGVPGDRNDRGFQKQRYVPKGEHRPRGPNEGLPRDDIGNRMPSREGRPNPGQRGKPRRPGGGGTR
jgi:23S rRNA pseudouridine2605 synthase